MQTMFLNISHLPLLQENNGPTLKIRVENNNIFVKQSYILHKE